MHMHAAAVHFLHERQAGPAAQATRRTIVLTSIQSSLRHWDRASNWPRGTELRGAIQGSLQRERIAAARPRGVRQAAQSRGGWPAGC